MNITSKPYPRAVVRTVDGGHTIRLSHDPEYFYDVTTIYPTREQALADAAAWVRVERAKGKTPTAVAGAADLPAVGGNFEVFQKQKVDGRKVSRKKPIPERCPKCLRRVRRSNEKLKDFPGTVSMALKDGTCQGCYYKVRKPADSEAAAAPKPEAPRPAPAKPRPAPKQAPVPRPPAKPSDLIPITPEPSRKPAGSLTAWAAAATAARMAAPDGHIVTIQGSGPLAPLGPSDPVERDRASLDAYLKRRGREGGAQSATLGRGHTTRKAGS